MARHERVSPGPCHKWGVVDLGPGPRVGLKHLPQVASAGAGWRGVAVDSVRRRRWYLWARVAGSALSSPPSVPQGPVGASPAADLGTPRPREARAAARQEGWWR